MIHFECQPLSGNPKIAPLVFDWDEVAGTVSGPGAKFILSCIAVGEVDAHPRPHAYTLGENSLKSRTDLAAIVGAEYRLPNELISHYPTFDDEPGLVQFIDADGAVIEEHQVLF